MVNIYQRRFLTLRQRFDLLYDAIPGAGCWLWSGWLYGNGYGCWSIGQRKMLAHRESWKLFVGPLSDSDIVCHQCDVRCCVNPAHLFVGTQRDNVHDAIKKGRLNVVGTNNPASKLTPTDVIRIRESDEDHNVIANRYGVRRQTIGRIKSRKDWKHID